MAIVYDYPGVTRDRMYTRAEWGEREFCVVDTGGLMSDATKLPSDKMMRAIRGISDVNLPEVCRLLILVHETIAYTISYDTNLNRAQVYIGDAV